MEEEHPASTMRCLSVRAKRIERLVCAQQSYARPRERLSGRLASPAGVGRPAGLRRSTRYVITTGSATTSGCSPLTAARCALSRQASVTQRHAVGRPAPGIKAADGRARGRSDRNVC